MANYKNINFNNILSYKEFHQLVTNVVEICNHLVTPEISYSSHHEWSIKLFRGPFSTPYLNIICGEGQTFMQWPDPHLDSIIVLDFKDFVKQYTKDVENEIKKWERMKVSEVIYD